MPWWAARTSNPVDAARHSGSIPPLERFYCHYSLKIKYLKYHSSSISIYNFANFRFFNGFKR